MPVYDQRVDDYISKSADFAKPILNHLRDMVHKAGPDVKETMKWSFPNFEYSGRILCSMAAFKQHCTFGFWLASLMTDPNKLLAIGEKTAMGHLGQIKSVADLPPEKVLIEYIKEAMALNEKGAKILKKRLLKQKKLKFRLTFLMHLEVITLLFQLLRNLVLHIRRNI